MYMTNELYFRLIAGSLGTGMLIAFALLVGLTAGNRLEKTPAHYQANDPAIVSASIHNAPIASGVSVGD